MYRTIKTFYYYLIFSTYFFSRPSNVVNDIHPNLNNLKDNNRECNNQDNNTNCSKEFDKSLQNILSIIVSYDMGWSTRGTGRSYDSLNGYGTIIGFFSGKILDYQTCNRKCRKCDLGYKKGHKGCRKNFEGSAKSMEAYAGAKMINNSKILKNAGLEVRVMIADEGSSTIASVRNGNPKTVYKLADNNHLVKNFGKELYELAKSSKELKKN